MKTLYLSAVLLAAVSLPAVCIIEKEQVCCSFLRFQLTVDEGGGAVIFDITGPKGTRETLKTL